VTILGHPYTEFFGALPFGTEIQVFAFGKRAVELLMTSLPNGKASKKQEFNLVGTYLKVIECPKPISVLNLALRGRREDSHKPPTQSRLSA